MLSQLPDSPSPTGFNASSMSQSMWSEDTEYVELEKEDRGLGFSILDYKVRHSRSESLVTSFVITIIHRQKQAGVDLF